MPQRRTAKKELRKNKTRRARNLVVIHQIKSAVKKFKKSLETDDKTARAQALREAYKTLDRAASKKVIHHCTADRKKSRLAKMLKVQPEKKTA